MSTIVELTPRGFELIEFKDHNGVECSIQQSSAIDLSTDDGLERPGSSLLWLGCDRAEPKYLVPDKGWQPIPMPDHYIANTRMHLDRKQVEALIAQLQAWLETGYFA